MDTRVRSVAIVAIVAVAVVGLTAAPTIATGGQLGSTNQESTTAVSSNIDATTATNTTNSQSTEWELLNRDTNERWTVPGNADLDEIDLPPGEYLAKKTIIRNGERETIDRKVVVENGETTITPSSTHDSEVGVIIADSQISYTEGDTVPIVVGIFNQTSGDPVSNAEVQIEIRDPSYDREYFNVTTDTDGQATFNYTINSSNEAGSYSIDVETPVSDSSDFHSFTVGEAAEVLDPFGDSIVGEQRTIHYSIMNGTTPVSGAEKTVTITHPNGTETTRTITTDADGIAEVSITPEEVGDYRLRLEDTAGNSFVSFDARNGFAEIYFGGRDYANLEGGQSVSIGGYAHDGGSPLANEELRVEIVNTTDYSSPVSVTNHSVTTDSNGNFRTNWTTPDVEQATFDVRVFSSSGELIGENNFYIYSQSDVESSSTIDIQMNDYQYEFYPGEEMEGVVTVTDQNGDPVTDREVRMTILLDYDGPPAGSITVTTNSSGQAAYSIPAPTGVGSTDVDVVASTQVNGEWIDDTDYVEVSQYQLSSQSSISGSEISAGDTIEKTYTLMDRETGNPISGESMLFHAAQSASGVTNLYVDRITTNSTGQATVDVGIPSDTQREVELEARSSTESFSFFEIYDVDTVNVEVSNINNEQFAPGEEVTISYSADDTLQGPVYVGATSYNAELVDDPTLVSTTLTPNEEITVTLPTNNTEFIGYELVVVGMNSSGASAYDSGYFYITPDETVNTPPTASFTYEPVRPDPGTTVTFNASESADNDGEIISYEWDLDGDGQVETTGETAEHTYEQTGNYTVQLTVTDNDGAITRTTKTVTVTTESGPPALPGFDEMPSDPDGDGKFEDLNGNGGLDIGDVQALFANQNSDVVQNNVEAFDFNNNGGIDIGDVQALFNEIM